MSDALRCPVCSCAALFAQFAHETAGAARIRHSLRPLIFEGGEFQQDSGAMRRENANGYRHPEVRALRCTATAWRASRDESARVGPSSFEARKSAHLPSERKCVRPGMTDLK